MASCSPVAVACCCPAEAAVFLLRERREVSTLIQTAEAERGGKSVLDAVQKFLKRCVLHTSVSQYSFFFISSSG